MWARWVLRYHAQVPRLKGRLNELLRKCEVSAFAARLRSGRARLAAVEAHRPSFFFFFFFFFFFYEEEISIKIDEKQNKKSGKRERERERERERGRKRERDGGGGGDLNN